MSLLLILTWLVPLAAAALAPSARFRWTPAVAALPALAAAALVPSGHQVEIPWLLLGSVLGLDDTSRIFLAFTSVLWLATGLYATGSMWTGPHAGRFRSFFLLAMAGNLWLIVGLDLVSFYAGFSLMGLASYALVVHEGNKPALRAGKVYLVMTMVGELALFAALVLIAGHAGTLVPDRAALVGLGDLAVGLLLLGLAIKAGLVPLHVWLPLAHPAAPVPASAVLSGAMIKVALLGWLRFLPVGETALTEWGLLLVFLGLVTLFFAIPVGLVQSNPKVILAYSSVGKMGLMALTLGLILLEPALAPAGILALALYAAHHALVKGGLFLGVGLRHHAGAQGLVLAGIAVLTLSLAGVPLSGGAVVKYGIKPILAGADWSWLTAALTLSTAGTALLMARFLWVIWRTEPHPSPGQALGGTAWTGLVALSLLFPLLLGSEAARSTNALPVGIALVLILPVLLVAWRNPDLLRPAVYRVPPGDLLGLVRPLLAILSFALCTLGRWWGRLCQAGTTRLRAAVAALGPAPSDPERGLRNWPNAGAAWLLVTTLLLALSLLTLPDHEPFEQPRVAAEVPAAAFVPPEPDAPALEKNTRPPTVIDVAGPVLSIPIDTAPSVASKETPAATFSEPEPNIPMARESERATSVPAEPKIWKPAQEAIEAREPGMQDVEEKETATPEPTSQTTESRTVPSDAPVLPEPYLTPRPQTASHDAAELSSDEQDARDADRSTASTAIETVTAERIETVKGPADQPAASNPEAIEPDDDSCDPVRFFVFTHPEVDEPLRLGACIQSPDGPRRLVAPPLTNPLVDLVQRHLSDLGYDTGPVDGLIGPMTRGAIRRFQRDRDYKPTGTIDFALLRDILAAAAAAKDEDQVSG